MNADIKFLVDSYLAATEWNLATMEELVGLKGTAKSRIARQRKICLDMLAACNEIYAGDPTLIIGIGQWRNVRHGRLAQIFKAAVSPNAKAATTWSLANALTFLLEGKLDNV